VVADRLDELGRAQLRLNFEYNLECYDRDLAAALDAIIDAKIALRDRSPRRAADLPFAYRLRNGVARLFSPTCETRCHWQPASP